MFEQQSYKYEEPAEPLREGDLFYNYEVGEWKFDNRIFAILGISLLLNLSFLGVVAQTNVLMAKGCDSPWVGRVCQVLDMAYVGTVLFGTDREYIDAAYERTELGEDVEVTWIDQTGVEPQFQYPEGYFYREPSPDQMAFDTNSAYSVPGLVPTNPVQSGSSLIDTPPVAPKDNPNAVVGKVPDSPFDLSGNDDSAGTYRPPSSRKSPRNKGRLNNSDANANTNAKQNDNTTAGNTDPTVKPTDPVDPASINKRPFMDLGDLVNEKIARKEVDLQTEFTINAKGKLNKDGRFDQKSFKIVNAASPDPDMVEITRRGIEAINESGYLKYLADLSGKDLDLQVSQDASSLSALLQTELESENRARTLSSLISSLIKLKMSEKEAPDASQNDKDDLLLLQNATVKQEGKKLVIMFNVPKDVVHKMLERKLAERAAESKKPNGNAMTTQTGNTAVK